MTRGEQHYMAGYNAGRIVSLQTGSAEAGHRWLAGHRDADIAYVAGYEWALWDYEDANGLAHEAGSSWQPVKRPDAAARLPSDVWLVRGHDSGFATSERTDLQRLPAERRQRLRGTC